MTAEATDAKLAWVREEAGSRFAELELCLLKFAVVISDGREAVATQVGKAFGGLTAEQVVADFDGFAPLVSRLAGT